MDISDKILFLNVSPSAPTKPGSVTVVDQKYCWKLLKTIFLKKIAIFWEILGYLISLPKCTEMDKTFEIKMIQGKQRFSSKRKKREMDCIILRMTFLWLALFVSTEPVEHLHSKCWVEHQLCYFNPAFSLDKVHLCGSSSSSAGHLEKSQCCRSNLQTAIWESLH